MTVSEGFSIQRLAFGDLESDIETTSHHNIALHLAGSCVLETPHGKSWTKRYPTRGALSVAPAFLDGRFRNKGRVEILKLSIAPEMLDETAGHKVVLPAAIAFRDRLLENLIIALSKVDAGLDEPYRHALQQAVLLHLARRPLENTLNGPGLAPWRITRALEFMESRLATGFTLAEFGAELGLAPTYASAQFKISMGCGPYSYFLSLRMERARALLCDKGMAVTDVAGRLGFKSTSYFSHRFSTYFGLAPRAFREKAAVAASEK